MLKVGDYFASRRSGAVMEVAACPKISGPGALQIRRLLRPGQGFPFPHVHLDLDESFKVETGVADARIGHRSLRLGEGEEFRVPRTDMHVNPCNRSNNDLVFLQTFECATTGVAERYVETLAQFLDEGRDVRGDLPPVVALAVFAGRNQQIYGPVLPRGFQRRVLFPLARSFEDWREDRRLRESEESAVPAEPGRSRWSRRNRGF